MPASHQCSKGQAHRDTSVVHSRTKTKGNNTLLSHLGTNLTLTLAKLVLRTKDLITKLLDGLKVFLGVCVVSWNSSKHQIVGGHKYIALQLELSV